MPTLRETEKAMEVAQKTKPFVLRKLAEKGLRGEA